MVVQFYLKAKGYSQVVKALVFDTNITGSSPVILILMMQLLNNSLNNFLSKPVTFTQGQFVTISSLAFADFLYFLIRTLVFGPSLYNNIHLIISPVIAILTIAIFVNKNSLDAFTYEIVMLINSNFVLPNWIQVTLINNNVNKNVASRCFLIFVFFFFDFSLIFLKSIVGPITFYLQIHLFISLSMLLASATALWIFYQQIEIFKKINSYKPSLALENIKNNPVLVEQHPFHILPPSALPFLTAIFTFSFLFSTVQYFHNGWTEFVGLTLTFSVPALLITLAYWFFSIHQEANEGFHTKKVRWNLLHGVMLFITSEVMLFFSIFWAFFHSSMSPTVAIYCTWPPVGIEIIDPWALPLLNTVILLSSGVSLTYAHRALANAEYESVSLGLSITLWYGILFTGIQLFEYINSPFSINDSVYGSVFFLATGFHGLHVIIGSIMLLITLIRNGLRQITATQHVGFIASAWYWHFVDVVWLFLFISIYWWGS